MNDKAINMSEINIESIDGGINSMSEKRNLNLKQEIIN